MRKYNIPTNQINFMFLGMNENNTISNINIQVATNTENPIKFCITINIITDK